MCQCRLARASRGHGSGVPVEILQALNCQLIRLILMQISLCLYAVGFLTSVVAATLAPSTCEPAPTCELPPLSFPFDSPFLGYITLNPKPFIYIYIHTHIHLSPQCSPAAVSLRGSKAPWALRAGLGIRGLGVGWV